MASTKLYLYMARRDKSNVKVLAVLQGEAKTSRIHSIDNLKLPVHMHQAISGEVEANRMLWEVWIEPAESYGKLKESLSKRGFNSLPATSKPIMGIKPSDSVNLSSVVDGKKKSMIQKGV